MVSLPRNRISVLGWDVGDMTHNCQNLLDHPTNYDSKTSRCARRFGQLDCSMSSIAHVDQVLADD